MMEIKDEELENEIAAAEDVLSEDVAAEETRTADPGSDEAPVEMDTPAPAEKMLTQSQVNELVGRARQEGRDSAMRELRERYGVADDSEMNDVFGRGQGYELLNDEYAGLNGRYKDLSAENALLKSKIVDSRWNDVKAILAAKGLDVTQENISMELATHPEWTGSNGGSEITPESAEMMVEGIKPGPIPPKPASTIRKLGSNAFESKEDTEEEMGMRYFGL